MLFNGDQLLDQKESHPGVSDNSESAIAKRIALLRKNGGLTLQGCAKRTGVAASTLSKIERGELSPTISTIQKIASGFGMDITELLTQGIATNLAKGRRAVSRAGEGKAHISNSCKNFLLCSELKNKRMAPIQTTVTARSTDDYPVWAQSDAEIFLWVLSGRMLLHTRIYEPLELGPGDSVYYDASGEHCWTSAKEQNAEVIWVITA